MNYATIKNCDIANGPGVRVSLFVSGCTHRCPGCFNEVAWDFDYGQPFTEETVETIVNLLRPAHIRGLTLLGGEPFEPQNQSAVVQLLRRVKQELPENESRQHTETVSLESKNKDMESVLALLPQEREFVTDDGLIGILTLQLDTVRVEPSGYASSTKEVSATRTYPNLAGQDTQYIPKAIQDNGRTLTLQDVNWQTDNTASMDGYALGDRFTAVATYTTTATSSYVKGYTVTADYTGTVSHIALDRVRYVAIYEGEPITKVLSSAEDAASVDFNWSYVAIPVVFLLLVGGGIGAALFYKRRKEEA